MKNKYSISETRAHYFFRLFARIVILLFVVFLYFFKRDEFNIAKEMKFFSEFSVLHILWLIWIADMIQQVIPVKAHISIGSQKVFQSLFKPIKEKINYKNLKKYIKDTTVSAYKVMII